MGSHKHTMFQTKLLWLLLTVTLARGHEDETHHPRPLQAKPRSSEDRNFWIKQGEDELETALNLTPNTGVAKNIILFIGDGMSLPTVTAARTFKGQRNSTDGDGSAAQLYWETFPYVGLSKTYSADYMVPDSAATASSMYTGQKTTFYTMGYDSSVTVMDPKSVKKEAEVETILDWAQAAGKKTGFVTNTRMSHATPAALYAKTVYRFWEGDKDIKKSIDENEVNQDDINKNNVKDISRQLVESEAGKKIDIMLGGGRSSFLPEEEQSRNFEQELRWDYDDEVDRWDNYRQDGRNLIEEWKANHTNGVYIENRTQLLEIDPHKTDSVMGIFTHSYVVWDDMVNDTNEKPRLTDMATAAVKFLQAKSGDEGFFIMIEGGRIDAAHHNGYAVRALTETLAFERAIQDVMGLVDIKDTLVIVTADHAHTMSIGGYTPRNVNITGGIKDDRNEGFPFTVLSYGNGPGFQKLETKKAGNYTEIERKTVTLEVNEEPELRFKQASAAPLSSETHGGDDVGIWSVGPWSHLIHGTHQQSYLATVMSYSGCLGKYKDRQGCGTSGGDTLGGGQSWWRILVLLVSYLVYVM